MLVAVTMLTNYIITDATVFIVLKLVLSAQDSK